MVNKFNVDVEEQTIHKIEKEERSKDVMCKELCVFLGRQRSVI
jgi:DNA-binding XRE family transcriptional regulator